MEEHSNPNFRELRTAKFAELGFSETRLPNLVLHQGRAENRPEKFHSPLEAKRAGRGLSMFPSSLLAALRSRRRFDRSLQLGHLIYETSREASMPLKHLATSIKVFLAVPHLIP
jgi:hypothetical protein